MFNTLIKNDTLSSFDQKVHQLTKAHETTREVRSVCDDGTTVTLISSPSLAILFVIICVVLFLLFLGIIKGLFGLYCCPPVGMCGLGALIDLPRPLTSYQENDLQEFPVKYDVIGWPVHPQTGKRTVRAISLRTEFSLNVIFFITYPLIMLITLLSLCCFTHVYDTEDMDKGYQDARTIMLTDCPSFMNKKTMLQTEQRQTRQQPNTIYCDNDSDEEEDTKYVLEQMHRSEQSLMFQR